MHVYMYIVSSHMHARFVCKNNEFIKGYGSISATNSKETKIT